MKRTALSAAMAVALGSGSLNLQAALSTGSVMAFDPGRCADGSLATQTTNCYYSPPVSSGSWFAMDGNGDGDLKEKERTGITRLNGVRIGAVQPASGSHAGAPDGTENPDIDMPWGFFGNTGMHQTTSALVELSDDGAGNLTLDFSGWDVTWNGIPSIPLGGDTANFPSDTGIAAVTCADPACADGTAFTLDYNAHVPVGDPSNFGGVLYGLHLEGTISQPGGAPQTNPDAAQTIVGNTVSIPVLINDSSADGFDATAPIAVVTPPAVGNTATVTVDSIPQDSTVDYTPEALTSGGSQDFTGPDTLQYAARSGGGVDSVATDVSVQVETNLAPVANADTFNFTTDQLNLQGGTVNLDVLSNDTDPNRPANASIVTNGNGDLDPATVVIVNPPVGATAVAQPDGTVNFTAPVAAGMYQFTYEVSDKDSINPPLTSGITTVTVNITESTGDAGSFPPDTIPIFYFEEGVPGDPVDTSVPAQSGSYFTMQVTPRTLIYIVLVPGPTGAIILDHDQPGGNTHTGAPNGTELTGVDEGWSFFGNTGIHFTLNGGITTTPAGTLDFSNRWIVSWNSISVIDLGGFPAGFPEDTGIADISCTPSPCADGTSFILDYAAHVAPSVPDSGFTGVPYTLHMEGTVGVLSDQLTTQSGALTFDRLSASEIKGDAGIPPDQPLDDEVDAACVGDCFELQVSSITESPARVIIPLASGIYNNAVYRILENGEWRSLDSNAGSVQSAPFAPGMGGTCPAADSNAYRDLTAGDYCLLVGIVDNGPNDTNPTQGIVGNLGGLGSGGTAGGGSTFVDTRTSSSSTGWGCSINEVPLTLSQRGDWWFLAGFVAWLGVIGWRRRRLH